jgi:hypothetical protein
MAVSPASMTERLGSRAAEPASAQSVGQDRDPQHRALHDLLVVGTHAKSQQAVSSQPLPPTDGSATSMRPMTSTPTTPASTPLAM